MSRQQALSSHEYAAAAAAANVPSPLPSASPRATPYDSPQQRGGASAAAAATSDLDNSRRQLFAEDAASNSPAAAQRWDDVRVTPARSPAGGVSPHAQQQQQLSPTQQQQARSSPLIGSVEGRPFSPSAQAQPQIVSLASLQRAVNDVHASRFSSFLPQAEDGTRPVSVLVLDDHQVAYVPPGSGALSPYAQQYLSPRATEQDAQIVAISPTHGAVGAARPQHSSVYTFASSDEEALELERARQQQLQNPPLSSTGRKYSSSLRRSPSALYAMQDDAGRGAAAAGVPAVASPSGSGMNYRSGLPAPAASATAASPSDDVALVPVVPSDPAASTVGLRPNLMSAFPTLPVSESDLSFRVHGCWDVDSKHLLYAGWAVLALMLLFDCIAFGVSWTTADRNVTGYAARFFIGHYKENTATGSSSGSYSSAGDFRRSCAVDNERVPACLGLCIPILFATGYCMWKRSQNHNAVGWRRMTILCLLLVALWSMLACVLWWHGCYTYLLAAVDASTGQLVYQHVVFAGGWWLALVNMLLAFAAIFVQATAYGTDVQCCICVC